MEDILYAQGRAGVFAIYSRRRDVLAHRQGEDRGGDQWEQRLISTGPTRHGILLLDARPFRQLAITATRGREHNPPVDLEARK